MPPLNFQSQPSLNHKPLQVRGLRAERVPAHVLLPHEVLHALACSSQSVFQSVIMGDLSEEQVVLFWEHVHLQEPWKDHPVLNAEKEARRLGKLIPVTFHSDGVETFSNSEHFVWSISSAFGHAGLVTDVLMNRFPLVILPESQMQDTVEPRQHWLCTQNNGDKH